MDDSFGRSDKILLYISHIKKNKIESMAREQIDHIYFQILYRFFL